MKLENQVVSLELAQKMKELGFEQDSLFYWKEQMTGSDVAIIQAENPADDDYKNFYSAYTVAELGEMLPSTVYTRTYLSKNHPTNEENKDYIEEMKQNNWYAIHYEDNMDLLQGYKTEADARATILIYLKEKKFNLNI